MLTATLLLLAGLILLIGGADVLVRGVSALAAAAGVPPLVIGLTLVAFGTSTPEMVVNGIAAYNGETALAYGNVVGSCAVNIGWVLAVTALVRPLTVEPSVVSREIPMMLLGVAGFAAVASDALLRDGPVNVVGRGDGIVLLLLFGVFVYYTVRGVLVRPLDQDALVAEVRQADVAVPVPVEPRRPSRPTVAYVLMTLGGIVGVAAGGRLVVAGATTIAARLGVPDVIVGLTIVSFGTTLPELATGVLAARRGQGDIAVGNVVGSNIFNLLAVGGAVAVIRPVPVPAGGHLDLLVMAGLSVALLPIALRGPMRITRAEGGCLLAAYLAYATWRTWAAL
ncbi:MAG TPA: calcium/sodium antiporter [Tepidisphaeraceae bacterium]|nr:calcium/sodium antiporter [Tepidisphaeraceae bacterium]